MKKTPNDRSHMDTTSESDAALLWQDASSIMEDRGLAPNILAMVRSCKPVSMDDTTITVQTSNLFVQRKLSQNIELIETCLSEAAFQRMSLDVQMAADDKSTEHESATSQVSSAELEKMRASLGETKPAVPSQNTTAQPRAVDKFDNPLFEEITETDARLTFERFVRGEENNFAFQAATQVADGINTSYNPLFIYGKSGLGKTHLLKAIHNYIAKNDHERLCVYRTSRDFQNDYVRAFNNNTSSAQEELTRHYRDVDVLIIDDIQNLTGAGTINFFFDTFNHLRDHGKQIVLAADRTPTQLGLDERVASRINSGFTVSIEVPRDELKLLLVENFYQRMKEDAKADNVPDCDGEISRECLEVMARKCDSNIRNIESFCQMCLIVASQRQARGKTFTAENVMRIARDHFNHSTKIVSVQQIQDAVEKEWDISHNDLIGQKRDKEAMEPRHVAIWLTRQMTDSTLMDIGKRFGGRKHATIKHSIAVVDERMGEDKLFYDRVTRVKESIVESI